jgi:hypothetical protein
MKCRLWLGDIDRDVAAYQDALDWRRSMHRRGYSDMDIERDPEAEPTFPVPEEEEEYSTKSLDG